ncbi:hypothetical protein J2D73_16705 [Acetobacter sacchari]|uniref:Uncharacterized protein n=1 Tax=Acetobacter sacchari TaxID=2661687 RepID=A0ABS3LZT7_9PROT|nr:hypothetical protein [Acetobacter sacchari]MBO1361427.1 hypothetical protein [Acetobacter sacchari]
MKIELEKIRKFLPETGEVAIVGMVRDPDAGFSVTAAHHVWLDLDRPDLLDYIEGAVEALQARGATDFYWTPAAFEFEAGVPKRRNAAMAKAWRCFYADLDAHGGDDGYANPRAALEHLFEVCQQVNLMPSCVVFTGRGVQAIWGFDQDLSVTRWRVAADDIWTVLSHYGLKMDPACRQDRARVIRLPGTTNSVAGAQARVVYEGDLIYIPRRMVRYLQVFMTQRGIMPPPEPKAPVARAASDDGTVFDCETNRKTLEFLLDKIPSSFTGRKANNSNGAVDPKSGYERWRDVVWAAKRTGLPNAWSVVYDWAHKAAREYDDLDEALTRTWDSDNAGAANAIGPGTLVMTARQFCRRKADVSALQRAHFINHGEAVLRGEALPDERVDWWGHQIVRDEQGEVA